MKPALLVFAIVGAALGWAVWAQYGAAGVGMFVLFLLALAAIPWFIGTQGHHRAGRAWAMLAQAHDAVSAGAPAPDPEQWEPWLVEMAAERAQYEAEIYARAEQIDHPFREPWQRLLCGFPTDRARDLVHRHLKAHSGDLVAPQLAAYLIARGDASVYGAAVTAALQACAAEELLDPAASLLSCVEAGDAAAAWVAATVAHHAKLREALADDEDLQSRWDAALGAEVTDA